MLLIILLIDGLGYDYLPPESFWKRHSYPIKNAVPTITAPNWMTILTGLSPRQHGITKNEQVSARSYVSNHSTFLDDLPKPCVLISDWRMMYKLTSAKFVYSSKPLKDSWAYIHKMKNGTLVVNYSRLDTVAHQYHWGSEKYFKTFKNIDNYTREISLLNYVRLIGVSDHGGIENDHEEKHEIKVRRVPLLLYGFKGLGRLGKIRKTGEIRNYLRNLNCSSCK